MNTKEKKELIKLVKQEAKNLKELATKKEIANLKILRLDAHDKTKCVYGQMAKSCFTERAKELIAACAPKLYTGGLYLSSNYLDGAPSTVEDIRDCYHWSPIEVFIYVPSNATNGNNAILIAYLKGQRKTLSFKPF
jgi:hypothetical protein